MSMKTVSHEAAVQEVERWLDFKKVKDKKRAESESFIEILVGAVEDGLLTIDKDLMMKYSLLVPVKDDNDAEVFSELTFVPRIQVGEINKKLRGIKADDADGRVVAYIAALTKKNTGMITKLFTEDYSVCQSIVMFFL